MILASITGDREVAARLRHMPARLHDGLLRRIARLAIGLQRKVQTEKLAGQVLKARTGALRSSIDSRVEHGSNAVIAIVSATAKYAPRHEYGAEGAEQVRAHLRTIKRAWGRPLKDGTKRVAVRAHRRQVNYPARSFLRSALAELSPEIRDELKEALAQAVRP